MNLIDIEDRLKDLSDQQLMQQMQRPDGTAPQFLVMSELKRRKEMRDKAPAPETTTVKDDLVQQGIASVANQMLPQDGIPRFKDGMFPGTNIAVRPTAQDYARYLKTVGGAISQGMSGPNTLPKIFDRSSKGMTVTDVRRAFAAEPMFGGDESAGDPRLTSEQIFNPTGARSYDVQPRNLIQRQRAPGTDPDSMLGDVTPPEIVSVPGHADSGMLAPRRLFASGPQMTAGDDYVAIDPDRSGDFPNFGVEEAGASSTANPQNQPPASSNQFEGTSGRLNLLGGLNVVPRGTAMPGGVSGDYGEVNAATDLERMYNQIMSAPPSAAPAAPPTNYYEGIEKKLAALQEAETGPDVGMALLRAGLGIAQAGGEGKSTAAAIGAGGIAGLDAYEADKKAKQARQMQLMGVESQLAGAKTQQDYNQQKLALDARQRDIAEKGLRLRAMGQLSDNETRRYIANQTAALQQQRIALDQQTIGIKDRALDETIRNNKERIKAIIGRNEALADSKIAPYKFFLGLNEEDKNALLPFIQRSAGRTTANNLDKNTLQLFKEGGMRIEAQLEQQFKEAGIDRPVTVNDVYTAARQIVSGQRPPPAGLDPARILGGS